MRCLYTEDKHTIPPSHHTDIGFVSVKLKHYKSSLRQQQHGQHTNSTDVHTSFQNHIQKPWKADKIGKSSRSKEQWKCRHDTIWSYFFKYNGKCQPIVIIIAMNYTVQLIRKNDVVTRTCTNGNITSAPDNKKLRFLSWSRVWTPGMVNVTQYTIHYRSYELDLQVYLYKNDIRTHTCTNKYKPSESD